MMTIGGLIIRFALRAKRTASDPLVTSIIINVLRDYVDELQRQHLITRYDVGDKTHMMNK